MKLLLVLVLFITLLPAAEATILGSVRWSDGSAWSSTNSVTDRTINVADTEDIRVFLSNPYVSGSITYTVEARSIATGRVVDTFTETIPSSGSVRQVSVGQGSSYNLNIPTDNHYDYTFQLSARQSGSELRTFGPARLHFIGNRAPVLSVPSSAYTIDERETVTFDVTGTDADNDDLTLVISPAQPSGSTLTTVTDTAGSIVKSFSWTPSLSQAGVYNVDFRLADGNLADVERVTITVVDNAAPTVTTPADGATFSVLENNVLTVDINANDANGDTISYEAYKKSFRTGAHYPLPDSTFNSATGVLTFSPGYEYVEHPDTSVADRVYFRANDGHQYSAERSLVITTNDNNRAPTAISRTVTVDEDATSAILLTGSDADPEDEEEGFTFRVSTPPAHGSLTGTAPNLQYTPEVNFNGVDSLTFHVTDQVGGPSLLGTITINVRAMNDAPSANHDSYTTLEDTTLPVAAPGVLDDDSDIDGDSLTAVLESAASHGTVTLNADGSFIYTPTADYNGADSFSYRANDGTTTSDVAIVTLTVGIVNDPPVWSALSDKAIPEDSATSTIVYPNIVGQCTDVDSPVSVSVTSDSSRYDLVVNAGGDLVLRSPGLPSNYNDAAGELVTLSCNGISASFTLRITAVNDAPTAVDDSYTTTEDTGLTIAAPGVLANDADVEGDTLTAVWDSGPANGVLSLSSNGRFVYTPNADYNGVDSFTYHARDGAANSLVRTVSITVTSVNDAPTATDDAYTTNEDTALAVAVAAGVLANDVDVEGNSLSAVLDTNVSHGLLSLNSDGSFSYTPSPNYYGSDSFTYHVSDGTLDSASATVMITILSVNDAPVAAADAATTNEDVAVDVAVVGNDSDADGDTLSVSAVTDGSNGAVAINADGTVRYTPAANWSGSDSFTYTVSDGIGGFDTATVSVTVNPVNDAPTAVDDAAVTDEDVSVAVDVLANDYDVEGNSLTIVTTTNGAHGSAAASADALSVTYTPEADYYGADSFTYEISDGLGGRSTATVTVTVNPVNDAPIAGDVTVATLEDTAYAFDETDFSFSDVDGDSLYSVTITSLSGQGSFDVAGVPVTAGQEIVVADLSELTFTPETNESGTDYASFTFLLSDGLVYSNSAEITIDVTPVNDVPVASDDSYSTDEDTALTVSAVAGVLANDADVDGDSLTAVLDASPTNGALTLFVSTGSFVYTPNANFNGVDSFTYHADDGTDASNIVTVTITVTPVNDAPTAVDDSYAVDEEATLFDLAPGVLSNDADVDRDILTTVLATDVSFGTLTLNDNGSFAYTPSVDFAGTDSFTYMASDGVVDSNVATVTITIAAVNDAPIVADIPDQTVAEGSVFTTFDLDSYLTEVDGDAVTWSFSGATDLTVSIDADNVVTVTAPSADWNGAETITFMATDGSGASGSDAATFTITAVNDAPVASDVTASTDEDTEVIVLLPYSDADSGDVAVSVVVSNVVGGTITTAATCSVAGVCTVGLTPLADSLVDITADFTVNDGEADSNTAQITVTVNPFNDAPVAQDDSYTTDEDTLLTIIAPGVLSNDADADGDVLTVSAADTAGTRGVVTINTINGDGSFTYDPSGWFNDLNVGATAEDRFRYTVTDGTVTDEGEVIITITGLNDAPFTVDDSRTTRESVAVTVDVLANDNDVDGTIDATTVVVVSAASDGTTSVNSVTGEVTYTPNPGFEGVDTFTYTVEDNLGAVSRETMVTITITDNVVPVITGQSPDPLTVAEDGRLTITLADLLVTDPDNVYPDDFTLTVLPDSGTYDVAPGSNDILPAADFNGMLSVGVQVNDGLDSSATFFLNVEVTPVNDAPTLNPIGDKTTDENVELAFTVTASDIDGDVLMFSADTPPSGASLDAATGEFSWTPTFTQSGSYPVTFTVSDGEFTDEEMITITVNDVNQSPVFDQTIVPVVVNEGETVSFTLTATDPDTGLPVSVTASSLDDSSYAGDVFTWVTDFTDGQTAAYSVTFTADDGTATATQIVSITVNDVNTLPAITLIGNNPQVVVVGSAYTESGATAFDNEDGDLSAAIIIDASSVVAPLSVGTYSVTYSVTDSDANTVIVTRTVNVIPTNTVPTITLLGVNPFDIMQGTAYAEPGYSASDAEDGNLTAAVVVTGSVDENTPGTYTLTYTITDSDSNTVSVTRTVNVIDTEAPIITLNPPNPQVIEVNTPYVELGATAVDNGDGSVSVTSNGATVVVTSMIGTYTITYTATDAEGNTATLSRTVQVVDTSLPTITLLGSNPVTIEVGTAYVDAGATATDNSGEAITVTVDSSAVNTTRIGTYTVTYTATDSSGNIATSTRTVTVVDTTSPTGYSVSIDQASIDASNQDALSFTFSGAEVGTTYTFEITDGSTTVTGTGTVTASNQQVSSIDVSSLVDGTLTLTVTLTDASGNVGPEVTDTVAKDSNQAPVIDSIVPLRNVNMDEGDSQVFVVNAHDPEGEDLTYSWTLNGVPVGTDTNTFTFATDFDDAGDYTLTVTISDGVRTTTVTWMIHVDENTAPLIVSEPDTTAIVGEEWVYEVIVEDDSPVTITVDGPNGMVIEDGVITWTPDDIGSEEVTITVTDGQFTVTQTFVINVEKARNDIKIMKVSLPEEVTEGSLVPVKLFLQNKGTKDLSDARITVQMPELGIKRSSRAFDMDAGDSKSGTVNIQLPYSLEARDYLVKITLSNDHFHESVYRYVYVVS